MPRWRSYQTKTPSALSDVPQAIHVSSDHRGMGSVASHLRGSSVHSFVYSYIYIDEVGEKLRTHTTPLRLLRRRLGPFASPRFSSLLPPILRCCSSFLCCSRIRSFPP